MLWILNLLLLLLKIEISSLMVDKIPSNSFEGTYFHKQLKIQMFYFLVLVPVYLVIWAAFRWAVAAFEFILGNIDAHQVLDDICSNDLLFILSLFIFENIENSDVLLRQLKLGMNNTYYYSCKYLANHHDQQSNYSSCNRNRKEISIPNGQERNAK